MEQSGPGKQLPGRPAHVPAPNGKGVDDKRTNLPEGSETILLVEDEPAARQAIADFLEDLGYEVIQAANGRDALAIFSEAPNRINLIVSDLIMPYMNGAELAKEIWKQNANLPVFFVSAYGDDDIKSKLPADCIFFQKPFRLERLARTLREKLEKGSF